MQSQLLPDFLLVSRRNRKQRPSRTSWQKAIFLCKQNSPPLAVNIFPKCFCTTTSTVLQDSCLFCVPGRAGRQSQGSTAILARSVVPGLHHRARLAEETSAHLPGARLEWDHAPSGAPGTARTLQKRAPVQGEKCFRDGEAASDLLSIAWKCAPAPPNICYGYG